MFVGSVSVLTVKPGFMYRPQTAASRSMKQAENSGRGVMINMNNIHRLCREGVGASMVDGTKPEPTV